MAHLNNLPTVLSLIFLLFLVALAGELLYILWRHRRCSSPAPPIDAVATKDLLYFFCLKPHTPVELDPAGGRSPDDQVVDVFKLLEVHGPSRFLCTIKEEDKEDVESMPDVDILHETTAENVCARLTVDREDGDTRTVFSTPCDSPMFFTPVGSPARGFME